MNITNRRIEEIINILDLKYDEEKYFIMDVYNSCLSKDSGNDNILDLIGVTDGGLLVTVEPVEEDVLLYKYNPSLMGYDLYGDPAFGELILYINNMTHPAEFNMKRSFKLFSKVDLEYIKTIYIDIKTKLG